MKTNTVLFMAVALAAAGLAVVLVRRGDTGAMSLTGDAERLAGVDYLYSSSTKQQAITQAAIEANWRELAAGTASQPDWWI